MAGAWLERALAACVSLLPPLLALVPHGAAPLAAVAGLCALGRIAIDPPRRLAALGYPAGILGALLLWGGISAAWSIDPGRSLLMEARLAGLLAAALALAAAAERVAQPRRWALALLAGTASGIVLAGGDLASAGALSRLVSVRPFAAPRLDAVAAWIVLLLLPVAAGLFCRSRRVFAMLAAAVLAAAIYALADTTAKIAFALSLPVAALLVVRRRTIARAAAALSVIAILAAPLILPPIAGLPGVFAAVDAFKTSAGHRLLIWSFTGDRIAERPFAGWGLDSARAIPGGKDEIRPGQQWLPLHPHNAALQVWLELGAPGAALFALFLGWLWLRVADAVWPPVYAAAAGGSLSAALAVALSGWGIWEEWWLATLAFALFAILVLARAAGAGATPPRRRGWRGGGR